MAFVRACGHGRAHNGGVSKADNTLAGTLKVEIIKPEIDSWADVAPRLFAMRDTIGPALNRTMRDLFQDAVDGLAALQRKEGKEAINAMLNKVEKLLRLKWNEELSVGVQEGSTNRGRLRGILKRKDIPDSAFELVNEYWSAETRHNIESRFSGEHLKDLLANRASFPSWHSSAAFYARSRSCKVEGPPSQAVLSLPLWGAGEKATRMIVAPCGRNGEAMWRKLVDGSLKLGRVGVAYDSECRQWFALISWSGLLCAEVKGKGEACAHIATTNFVQIVSQDGNEYHVSGEDILVTRARFFHRRDSIHKCQKSMGMASKGRGAKRRMLPIERLNDSESRFVTTRIRQVAHDVIGWCLRHNVGTLYWPDMTGARESFEAKTGGEAHEEVKRLIHSFPFFELHKAVERDGKERGVCVRLHCVAYDSQTCPKCGAVDSANLYDVAQRVEALEHHGRRFERREVIKRFKCSCGFRGHRDVVACVNALSRLGHKESLKKVQSRIKTSVKAEVEMVGG